MVSEIRTLASRAIVRTGSTDDHAAWLEQLLADPRLDERIAEPSLFERRTGRRVDPDALQIHARRLRGGGASDCASEGEREEQASDHLSHQSRRAMDSMERYFFSTTLIVSVELSVAYG